MEQYYISKEQNDAFARCYKKHARGLVRYIHRMVHNVDIAEELAHDAFLKLYEKNYDLDPDSKKTVNLMITVAKNRTLDYLKRRKMETCKYREKHFEDVTLNEAVYRSLEDHYIESEILSTLRDAINDFPAPVRDALAEKLYDENGAGTATGKKSVSKYHIRQAERRLHEQIRKKLKDCP